MKRLPPVFAFVFIFALFGIAAAAQGEKKKPETQAPKVQSRMARPSVATADSMSGIRLSDYADFWKNPAKWHFVTVRYRKDTGEMRLTYANDSAWQALLAGGTEYPEGAVFAKIGLMTQEDPAFTSSAVPAGARRYQLMVRDKVKGAETNGWAYALFDGAGKAVAEDQDIAARACWACHALVPERAEVFSQPFHLDIGDAQGIAPVEAVSRIEFATVKVSALPEKIRARLPAGASEVRVVQGKLAENLFRGTMDEIRPTLVRETMKTKLPAILMSVDGTLFSAVYITPESCTADGGGAGTQIAGFYTTGVLPGRDSVISEHRHCEK